MLLERRTLPSLSPLTLRDALCGISHRPTAAAAETLSPSGNAGVQSSAYMKPPKNLRGFPVPEGGVSNPQSLDSLARK